MRKLCTIAAVAALSATIGMPFGAAQASSVGTFAFSGDAAFNSLCSATDAGAGGTGNTACEFGVGEIRFGNGATNGDRELGINDPNGAPDAEGQRNWTSGTPYTFSFDYDAGTSLFTLDVGGTVISSAAPSLSGASSLFIRSRDRDLDDFVTLSNLALNGHSFSAGALGGFSSNPEYLQVFGIDFESDWELTGDIEFLFGTNSRGSSPAVQFKVTNVAPIPLPAAAWMLLAGLGGLFVVGRRRAA